MAAVDGEGSVMTRRLSGKEEARMRRLRTLAIHEQKGLCCWCHQPMVPVDADTDRAATAEHVTPVSDGGRTTWWNVRAACRECNNGRNGDPAPILTAGDDSAISPFEALGALRRPATGGR
jgi:hypothetical protein